MHTKIENETRGQIAEFLPEAIATALLSYQVFLGKDVPGDAKDFKAHHDACKVAIAHVELLIKLAQWADLPDPAALDVRQQAALEVMMEDACREIEGYKQRDQE